MACKQLSLRLSTKRGHSVTYHSLSLMMQLLYLCSSQTLRREAWGVITHLLDNNCMKISARSKAAHRASQVEFQPRKRADKEEVAIT